MHVKYRYIILTMEIPYNFILTLNISKQYTHIEQIETMHPQWKYQNDILTLENP